jgi:hypothetical protein
LSAFTYLGLNPTLTAPTEAAVADLFSGEFDFDCNSYPSFSDADWSFYVTANPVVDYDLRVSFDYSPLETPFVKPNNDPVSVGYDRVRSVVRANYAYIYGTVTQRVSGQDIPVAIGDENAPLVAACTSPAR